MAFFFFSESRCLSKCCVLANLIGKPPYVVWHLYYMHMVYSDDQRLGPPVPPPVSRVEVRDVGAWGSPAAAGTAIERPPNTNTK
jgi:hypothetical protein